MHLGAAQLLVGGLLAGGHLHQGWATQEHLGPFLHHHRVVAHAGHVRPAGGGVAEHEGDGGDAELGELGEIAEPLAAGEEHLGLVGQVRPTRLHQVDHGKPVLAGDVLGAQRLGEGVLVGRSGLAGGVVGRDHHLDPVHHTDPGDDVGAQWFLGAPPCQGRQLQEGTVTVDQQLDPLVDEHLSALGVAGLVLGATAIPRLGHEGLELADLVEHGRAVGDVLLGRPIDLGREWLHHARLVVGTERSLGRRRDPGRREVGFVVIVVGHEEIGSQQRDGESSTEGCEAGTVEYLQSQDRPER